MPPTAMTTVAVNGIELCYDTVGDRDGAPLLLIMGLGAQLVAWEDDFCAGLADRGFFVVRYDNRDVGLSTKLEHARVHVAEAVAAALGGGAGDGGEEVQAPYILSDMADDAAGLLDALDIPAAHVVGASMGGMIGQTLAIEHPARVLTLTSVMSTTGDPDVGLPTPEALQVLLTRPPAEREAAIEHLARSAVVVGTPGEVDEQRARLRAARAYDRCFYPIGVGRQLVAVLASGSRSPRLAELDVPTLVIHGSGDPLVAVSGGRRTAEVVPGAELLEIEGMGHDLPPIHWPRIIEAITAHAARATVEV